MKKSSIGWMTCYTPSLIKDKQPMKVKISGFILLAILVGGVAMQKIQTHETEGFLPGLSSTSASSETHFQLKITDLNGYPVEDAVIVNLQNRQQWHTGDTGNISIQSLGMTDIMILAPGYITQTFRLPMAHDESDHIEYHLKRNPFLSMTASRKSALNVAVSMD
ncbi:MAG: hypothetical protein HQM11_15550 [SAR324 cluster bacterium]|nr:hypothetical protein [SAR324 cluster bacterium]